MVMRQSGDWGALMACDWRGYPACNPIQRCGFPLDNSSVEQRTTRLLKKAAPNRRVLCVMFNNRAEMLGVRTLRIGPRKAFGLQLSVTCRAPAFDLMLKQGESLSFPGKAGSGTVNNPLLPCPFSTLLHYS